MVGIIIKTERGILMSLHQRKKYDPNELSWVEVKFNRSKYSLLRKYRYDRRNQSEEAKQLEIEGIIIIKQIEDYGFKFFAPHYVCDLIEDLDKITAQM